MARALSPSLDFFVFLSLTSQQRELVTNLVATLVQRDGFEQTVPEGYRPAALIQTILEHVRSPDTFLTFFLSFIYEYLCSNEETVVSSDITCALSYFDDLALWTSEQTKHLHEALEKFAECFIETFLLPRMLSPDETISLS